MRCELRQSVGMEISSLQLSLPEIWRILTIFMVFLLAGTVKGVIGLGLPTVAVGLLNLVMTPTEAAAILLIPSFFTNVWQMVGGPGLVLTTRRLAPALIGICLGTSLGALASRFVAQQQITAALGVALMLYAMTGRSTGNRVLSARAERWLGPLTGACTGAIAGATGIFVLPAVPYLRALGMSRVNLLQAMGLSFTVSTIALGVVLACAGDFHVADMGLSCFALLPAVAGMALGRYLNRNMDPAVFARCFFAGLFLLGSYFAFGALVFR